MASTEPFREIDGLTNVLRRLLASGVLLRIVTIGVLSSVWLLLRQEPIDRHKAEKVDEWGRFVSLLALGLLLATSIVLGIWVVRAHRNLRAMGAKGLSYKPGQAYGSFFIPIGNFYAPYRAMVQLWQASHAPSGWRHHAKTWVLHAWWAIWLTQIAVNIVANVMEAEATTQDEVRLVVQLDMTIHLLGVFCCLALHRVATGIGAAQSRWADERAREPVEAT